jgi:hypothetical protein
MGYSAFDTLPPSFQDFLLAHVAAKAAQNNEISIWRGVNATAGQFDGLVTLATADATVIDVVGEAVTAANVIAEMGSVIDAIPSELYGQEDLYLICISKCCSCLRSCFRWIRCIRFRC